MSNDRINLNLCNINKYTIDEQGNKKANRIPGPNEDIEIINIPRNSGILLDMDQALQCSLNNINGLKIRSLPISDTGNINDSSGRTFLIRASNKIVSQDRQPDNIDELALTNPLRIGHEWPTVPTTYKIGSIDANYGIIISGLAMSSDIITGDYLLVSDAVFADAVLDVGYFQLTNTGYIYNIDILTDTFELSSGCKMDSVTINNRLLESNGNKQSIADSNIDSRAIILENTNLIDCIVNYDFLSVSGDSHLQSNIQHTFNTYLGPYTQYLYSGTASGYGLYDINKSISDGIFAIDTIFISGVRLYKNCQLKSRICQTSGPIYNSGNIDTVFLDAQSILLSEDEPPQGLVNAGVITTEILHGSDIFNSGYMYISASDPRYGVTPTIENYGYLSLKCDPTNIQRSRITASVSNYHIIESTNATLINATGYLESTIQGDSVYLYGWKNQGQIITDNCYMTNASNLISGSIQIAELNRSTNYGYIANGNFYSSMNSGGVTIGYFWNSNNYGNVFDGIMNQQSNNYGNFTSVAFYSGSKNYGTLKNESNFYDNTMFVEGSGKNVNFYNSGVIEGSTSIANAQTVFLAKIDKAKFYDTSRCNNAEIAEAYFYDNSICNNVKTRDNIDNIGLFFYNESVLDNGTGLVYFAEFNDKSDIAYNGVLQVYSALFRNNAVNGGLISGVGPIAIVSFLDNSVSSHGSRLAHGIFTFRDTSVMSGQMLGGKIYFYDNSYNDRDSSLLADYAMFAGTRNYGSVFNQLVIDPFTGARTGLNNSADILFDNGAQNYGTVSTVENCIFSGSSINSGTVSNIQRLIFDNSINRSDIRDVKKIIFDNNASPSEFNDTYMSEYEYSRGLFFAQIEADDVEFYNTTNTSTIKANNILFGPGSENTAYKTLYRNRLIDGNWTTITTFWPAIQCNTCVFSGNAINYSLIDTDVLTFINSINKSTTSYNVPECKLLFKSVNETFLYGDSINVYDSTNAGILNFGQVQFHFSGINVGIVQPTFSNINSANIEFINSFNHGEIDLSVVGGDIFFDRSINYGIIKDNSNQQRYIFIRFDNGSINQGIVHGDFIQIGWVNDSFSNRSINYGSVYGSAVFAYEGVNSGSVYGDATFEYGTSHYGIVYGNATFKPGSINSGVVTGDIYYSPN